MATREIKTRFKLEGEQEFKRTMTDAANSIKVLNSEQKLAKAQFEATGDAEQYAADQARILKEQIEQQKKSVQAAEDAIKKLTENGVEKNSKKVNDWKIKLNNAKTALYNMQTRLDKVGTELGEEKDAFGNAETAGHNFGEEMKKVATGINLQNAITAVDSIKSHIEQIVSTASRAAKAMWDMGVEGSVWADNLATAANEAGIDVETYQSWQYASRFIDTNVQDIINNFKDIDNKFEAGGDTMRDYMALLAEIGVASGKSDGSMRSSQEIFFDLIDYLHGIGDDTERTREAIKLFGNDWRKLNPLITAGSAAYKELAEEGRAVAVVSEENVNALGGMNDEYEDLSSRLTKLKMDTLAALAPTFNQVAQALGDAVTAMNEFVQSEEGQAALGELNEAVSGLITAFLGEDNGKGTFESIVIGAKKAVKKLTDALDWISKNGGTVKKLIEGLGLAWAGLTVTKEVLTFMVLLKALPLDKLGALFSGGKTLTQAAGNGMLTGGGGAGTGTAAGGGAATGTGKFMSAAKKTSLLSKAGDIALGVGIPAAVLAAGTVPAILANEWDRNNITEQMQNFRDAAVEAAQGMGEEGQKAVDIIMAATDAMGVSEKKTDVFHKKMMTDLVAVEDDLRIINDIIEETEEPVVSNKTRALFRHRQSVGGYDMQSDADLLLRTTTEAIDRLQTPQVEETRDAVEQLSDTLDDLEEMKETLEENITVDKIERAYSLFDKIIELPAVWEALSDDLKDKIGEYFFEGNGTGAGSNTQFSDFLDVVDDVHEELQDKFENMTGMVTTKAPEVADAVDNALESIVNPTEVTLSGDIAGNISDAMDRILEVQEALDEAPGDNIENLYGLIDELVENKDVFDSLSDATKDLLSAYFDPESGFGAGSAGQFSDAQEVLEAIFTDLETAWDEAYKSASDGGKQVDVGMANGIYDNADVAIKAAKWLAGSIATACSQVLMIHSPSKVFEEIGGFVGEGFAEGIEGSVGAVDRAMNTMMGATLRNRVTGRRTYSSESAAAGGADMVNVTLVLDDEVLGNVMAPIVNEKIGAKINATRR